MPPYRVMFVEPPKDYWFVMGEYLPPPTGLLVLAAWLEREVPDVEIEVVDSQAERLGWQGVGRRIASFRPDLVAASGFTANAYSCARVCEAAKRLDPAVTTVLGGQHFSATPEESLLAYPEVDLIVRGEGEVTLAELVRAIREGRDPSGVSGLSLRRGGAVVHTPDRPLIEDLDALPYPAYHLVEHVIGRYHFTMMAGRKAIYMTFEGGRGCGHRCTFCSQWRHWGGRWRTKSPRRIAGEIEHLHDRFGGTFMWFSDDNFGYGTRGQALYDELRGRPSLRDIMMFYQVRTDDVARHPDLVAKMRSVGNYWVLIGVESDSPERLREFKKGAAPEDAREAIETLNRNDVFTQAMIVIGSRGDTRESIARTREFSLDLGSDIAIYTVLTPFPGTEVFDAARANGWIEDASWANYDMVHAIMPTEALSRADVQQELYECYRAFYGSAVRGIKGVLSKNPRKRILYRHMASQRVLAQLRRLA